MRSSLFGSGQRFGQKKDHDVLPATTRPAREPDRAEKAADNTGEKAERESKIKPKEPIRIAPEDDNDSWGGLPSFLRRK